MYKRQGKGKGEFYTPKCIVNLIAEMLEPYDGILYDPCCGSGGMFVQSMKFVDAHHGNKKQVSIYGQEYTCLLYTSGLADFVRCYESVFLYMQKRKCGEFQKKRQQELKLSMESSRKRIADLDKLFSRIYEDNVIGKLSDERYARMAAEYESEQKELLEKVREEEKQLSEMEQKSVDMRLLLQGLREFTDMTELTPIIVNKLIRRIEVHNPEKKHARKSVKVDIYFTAVGLVSLPDEQAIRKMMEQMQSASQLPKQLTA